MKTVAIVGRPNVGKSTLVNRLVGKRETIVEESPGITRDRRNLRVLFGGSQFDIIDTGGWIKPTRESRKKNVSQDKNVSLDDKVSLQSEQAINEADVIILVVDTTTGVTREDEQVAQLIIKAAKPAVIACNKVDNEMRVADTWEFMRLGLGEPIAISALHGLGTGDLIEKILSYFPEDEPVEDSDDNDSFHVAIAGRPNVGKSTLFNRLIGQHRAIVHDMSGTTRDPIDTMIETEQGYLTFIDTAGLKKQSRQADNTEYYSSLRSFAAINRADCVLYIADSTEGITHYDMSLLERIDAAGCALVIILNKWDLLDTEHRIETLAKAKRDLNFVDYAPIMTISALSGRNINKIIPALFEARENYELRIPTALLNKVIHEAQIAHPHPSRRNRRVKISYATQGAVHPPTITIFASQQLDNSYMRYLENKLRDKFNLGSTAIKLRVRIKK